MIDKYLINFARPVVFGTTLSHIDVITLRHVYDVVRSARGDDVRITFFFSSVTVVNIYIT
jgi:hypothetical protein